MVSLFGGEVELLGQHDILLLYCKEFAFCVEVSYLGLSNAAGGGPGGPHSGLSAGLSISSQRRLCWRGPRPISAHSITVVANIQQPIFPNPPLPRELSPIAHTSSRQLFFILDLTKEPFFWLNRIFSL